ncbi:MAG: hypothetical protein KatS3mg082_1199 [Nitrospiraceae bacterium]|nr:MAG: hypothetical protein KatS3mg082_1199 [Nitrospiraceae bacterium]
MTCACPGATTQTSASSAIRPAAARPARCALMPGMGVSIPEGSARGKAAATSSLEGAVAGMAASDKTRVAGVSQGAGKGPVDGRSDRLLGCARREFSRCTARIGRSVGYSASPLKSTCPGFSSFCLSPGRWRPATCRRPCPATPPGAIGRWAAFPPCCSSPRSCSTNSVIPTWRCAIAFPSGRSRCSSSAGSRRCVGNRLVRWPSFSLRSPDRS